MGAAATKHNIAVNRIKVAIETAAVFRPALIDSADSDLRAVGVMPKASLCGRILANSVSRNNL